MTHPRVQMGAVLVPLAAVLFSFLMPSQADGEIVEEIAARVNDAIVTRSELQLRRNQIARQLADRYKGEELQARLRGAQDKLLFDMINEELLIQQAKLNFDMDRYFSKMKEDWMRINGIKTPAELNTMLEKEGLTQEGFRRLLLRGNVPRDILQFEVARKVSVSPEEIESYYKEHLDQFVRPGAVKLREIVILDQQRGREAARALVDKILARLAAGEEFAALAKELSESPSGEKGGLVGPFHSGELAPVVEDEAFHLPVGTVGNPIETSFGFQIIMVDSRTDTRTASLPEVSREVEEKVRQKKYSSSVDYFLMDLWRVNRIRVNPRYAIGILEDGGPYADRETLMPDDGEEMGPPAARKTEESGAGPAAEESGEEDGDQQE
ncbi:MAG: peptidylprolyl isomerase [Acidobacteriota bacterium]